MSRKYHCGTCRWYRDGMCYYNPPGVIFDTVSYKFMAVHPPVPEDELCGKWEEKRAKQAKA